MDAPAARRWLPPSSDQNPGLQLIPAPPLASIGTPWLPAPNPAAPGLPLTAPLIPPGDPHPETDHPGAGLAMPLPMPVPIPVPRPASRSPAATRPPLQLEAARVSVVRTANELQEAARDGAVDIEIRSHLDFRGLRAGRNPVLGDLGFSFDGVDDVFGGTIVGGFADRFLVFALPPTRSIRVRCRAFPEPFPNRVWPRVRHAQILASM